MQLQYIQFKKLCQDDCRDEISFWGRFHFKKNGKNIKNTVKKGAQWMGWWPSECWDVSVVFWWQIYFMVIAGAHFDYFGTQAILCLGSAIESPPGSSGLGQWTGANPRNDDKEPRHFLREIATTCERFQSAEKILVGNFAWNKSNLTILLFCVYDFWVFGFFRSGAHFYKVQVLKSDIYLYWGGFAFLCVCKALSIYRHR